jgi:sporulation protein YlmC with PRC-barrel domain
MADHSNTAPEDIGAPISYLVLPVGTPVYDRSGDYVGTVEHVLADDREDVFHGLILKTETGHRYAASAQVDGIFERGVIVAQPASALPEPSADPAAASADVSLTDQLKRAWNWITHPK